MKTGKDYYEKYKLDYDSPTKYHHIIAERNQEIIKMIDETKESSQSTDPIAKHFFDKALNQIRSKL